MRRVRFIDQVDMIPPSVDVTKLVDDALENDDISFFENLTAIQKSLKIYPDYALRFLQYIIRNDKKHLKNWHDISNIAEIFFEHKATLWNFILDHPDQFFGCWFEIKCAIKYFPEYRIQLSEIIFANKEKWFKTWSDIEQISYFPEKRNELAEFLIEKKASLLTSLYFLDKAVNIFPRYVNQWRIILTNDPTLLDALAFNHYAKSLIWSTTILDMIIASPHIFLQNNDDIARIKKTFPNATKDLENSISNSDQTSISSRFDRDAKIKVRLQEQEEKVVMEEPKKIVFSSPSVAELTATNGKNLQDTEERIAAKALEQKSASPLRSYSLYSIEPRFDSGNNRRSAIVESGHYNSVDKPASQRSSCMSLSFRR